MTSTISSHRPNPCNGCPKRYPACSAHCTDPEKIAWEEEQSLIRKNRKAYQCPIWTHGDRDSRRK